MAVLSDEEIGRALGDLAGWRRTGDALEREFTLPGGFRGSVAFVNRLAEASEAAGHHPDLAIRWNRVTVSWSTHSEGGITAADVRMAAQTDTLAAL